MEGKMIETELNEIVKQLKRIADALEKQNKGETDGTN